MPVASSRRCLLAARPESSGASPTAKFHADQSARRWTLRSPTGGRGVLDLEQASKQERERERNRERERESHFGSSRERFKARATEGDREGLQPGRGGRLSESFPGFRATIPVREPYSCWASLLFFASSSRGFCAGRCWEYVRNGPPLPPQQLGVRGTPTTATPR